MKYVTVTTSTIITQVAKRTLTPGYTEGVIECFLPDNPEDMTKKEEREWIKQNNKRMKAICKFLNENDL
jgi:hypothetical protein